MDEEAEAQRRSVPKGTQVGRSRGGLDPACLAPDTHVLSTHYRVSKKRGENLRLNARPGFWRVWESGVSLGWGCFHFGFGCGFGLTTWSSVIGMEANRSLKVFAQGCVSIRTDLVVILMQAETFQNGCFCPNSKVQAAGPWGCLGGKKPTFNLIFFDF